MSLYNAGNLSFVCNVGSLVNPSTNKQNWNRFIPVGLFSHSDEQRNWMTAMPDTQSQNIGFLGRSRRHAHRHASTRIRRSP